MVAFLAALAVVLAVVAVIAFWIAVEDADGGALVGAFICTAVFCSLAFEIIPNLANEGSAVKQLNARIKTEYVTETVCDLTVDQDLLEEYSCTRTFLDSTGTEHREDHLLQYYNDAWHFPSESESARDSIQIDRLTRSIKISQGSITDLQKSITADSTELVNLQKKRGN